MELSRARPGGEGRDEGAVQWTRAEWSGSGRMRQRVKADCNPAWAGDQDKALGDRIGAFRHVRSFAIDAVHKGTSLFIGARELWWQTLSDFELGVAGDRAAFDELLAPSGQHYTMLSSGERGICCRPTIGRAGGGGRVGRIGGIL